MRNYLFVACNDILLIVKTHMPPSARHCLFKWALYTVLVHISQDFYHSIVVPLLVSVSPSISLSLSVVPAGRYRQRALRTYAMCCNVHRDDKRNKRCFVQFIVYHSPFITSFFRGRFHCCFKRNSHCYCWLDGKWHETIDK